MKLKQRRFLCCTLTLFCVLFISPQLSAQTLGDVNSDTYVDVVDGLMIAQYYVGLIDPSFPGFDISVADVNCDGVINIVDALLVCQHYVELIPSFSCED